MIAVAQAQRRSVYESRFSGPVVGLSDKWLIHVLSTGAAFIANHSRRCIRGAEDRGQAGGRSPVQGNRSAFSWAGTRHKNSGRVTTMSENKRAEELDLGRIAHTDLAKKNLSSGVMPLRPRPEKAGNPDQ